MTTPIAEIGIRAVVLDLTQYRNSMASIRREAAITAGSMLNLSKAARSSDNPLQALARNVNQFGNTIRTLGNQLSNVGLRLSFLFSGPFIIAQGAIAKTGAEFEENMTKIETLADVAQDQVEAWSNQILELAPQLGALPNELAEGLYFVASTGFRDAKEAIDALTVSAKGAAIGLGETSDIARALVAAMAAFDITAEEAGDTLLQTVREGAAEADELATTIGRVLATAQNAGLTFQETGAFIATFTRLGVPAEVAVTSLRAALNSIIKPTSKAREQLAEYGFTIDDVFSAIREQGFARTLIALTSIFGNNAEAIANLIGTQRGLAGVLSVTGKLQDDYLDVLEKITGSTGELDEAFDRVTQTVTFQWKAFKSALDVVAQQIARVTLPALNRILQSLVPIVTKVAEFVELHPDLVLLATGFGLVAAAVGPLIFFAGAFISTVGAAIVLVGNFLAAIAALGPVGLAITGVFVGLTGTIAALVATFAATASSIRDKMDTDFGELVQRAKRWGYNLILEFARGIINAATLVVQALNVIGRIIASWLAPGSPPKLLPEIDLWGKATIEEWLRGWTTADFDIFGDLASTIEAQLRSFGAAGGTEGNVVAKWVIEAREALRSIIQEFRDFGTVSQESFDVLADTLKGNSDVILKYVRDMLDLEKANEAVAAAQDKVNAITEKYDAILSPLRGRLDDIRNRQGSDTRQDRRQQLQRVLVDPRATDEVRRRARLELEELNILDQIARAEAQRDTELSSAEEELSAAEKHRDAIQEQVEAQEKLLGLIAEENNLLSELVVAAKAIKDTAGNLGGGGGGGDLGGGGGIDDLGGGSLLDQTARKILEDKTFQSLGDIIEEVNKPLGTLSQLLSDLGGDIFELGAAAEDFSTIWAEVLDSLLDEDNTLNAVAKGLGKFVGRLKDLAAVPIKEIAENLDLLTESWTRFGEALGITLPEIDIAGGLSAALTAVWTDLVVVPLGFIAAQVFGLGIALKFAEPFIKRAREFWDEFVTSLTESEAGILAPIEWVNRLIRVLVAIFVGGVAFILGLVFGLIVGIINFFKDLYKELVGDSIVVDLMDRIKEEFERILDIPKTIYNALLGAASSVVSHFKDLYNRLVGPNGVVASTISGIVNFFAGLGQSIITAINGWINDPNNIYVRFYNLGRDLIDNLAQAIRDFDFVQWLWELINSAITKASKLINGFLGSISQGDEPGGPGGGTGPVSISNGSGGINLGGPVQGFSTSPFGGSPLAVASPPVVAGSMSTIVQVNMGGQQINSPMDAEQLALTIERRLARSMR